MIFYAEGVSYSAVTPKAFANSSPGLERSDNPGITKQKSILTLKGFLRFNPARNI